jgi:hypothetical protein
MLSLFLVTESKSNDVDNTYTYGIFHGDSKEINCNTLLNVQNIDNVTKFTESDLSRIQSLLFNDDGNVNKCIIDYLVNNECYYYNIFNKTIGFIVFLNTYVDGRELNFIGNGLSLFADRFYINTGYMLHNNNVDIEYYSVTVDGTNKFCKINIDYDVNNGFSWKDISSNEDIKEGLYKKITNIFVFTATTVNGYIRHYLIIGQEYDE